MKIVTIVGARPQFIKAVLVSQELSQHHNEVLVHTGQHYDYELSQVFFKDLELPKPDYNLGIGSGSHGYQTGQGIIRIEEVLVEEAPNLVLLYGDTNATLAGALAAVKLHIPIAHVEAGIRFYDKRVPEEVNRLITDQLCDLLFCPTQNAVEALEREGITKGVHLVGDVMLDTLLKFKEIAAENSSILQDLSLEPDQFYLATVHRPINTNNRTRLLEIFLAFEALDLPVILPLHPRTQRYLKEHTLYERVKRFSNITLINPVGYLDFLMLEQNARLILTDSGGVQREAYFLGVPCVTLKEEELCPWPETVRDGWNIMVLPDHKRILQTVYTFQRPQHLGRAFGDGTACKKVVEIINRSSINKPIQTPRMKNL